MEAGALSMARFASRIYLRLVSTVVLTRLLAPEIYGTFAIVLTYLFILDMLSDLGFRSLVLTREGDLGQCGTDYSAIYSHGRRHAL